MLESIFVDRFKTEEHGIQAEPLPQLEDLFVTQQHVAACFEVISFSDPTTGNGLAELHAVLGLNERYVFQNKNSRLAQLRQFLNGALGCLCAVVASVERPSHCKRRNPMGNPG